VANRPKVGGIESPAGGWCCPAVKIACRRTGAPAVSGAAFIYRRTLNGKPCLRRRLDHISGGLPAAHRRSLIEGGFVVVVKVAATNKCLARRNKSHTGGKPSTTASQGSSMTASPPGQRHQSWARTKIKSNEFNVERSMHISSVATIATTILVLAGTNVFAAEQGRGNNGINGPVT